MAMILIAVLVSYWSNLMNQINRVQFLIDLVLITYVLKLADPLFLLISPILKLGFHVHD